MQTETVNTQPPSIVWFDGFTKVVLSIMFVFLIFIFISAKYMDMHKMTAGGTDDTVNHMASADSGTKAHPFIELPGDAQVGAFSIANCCVGLIVGHLWSELFGKGAEKKDAPPADEKTEAAALRIENETEEETPQGEGLV